jgi:hypothetical protein
MEHGLRCEEYLELDLIETEWEGTNWFCLAQDKDLSQAFVNTLTNFWISSSLDCFLTTVGTTGCSRKLLHRVT